jgi:pilus assembly protein CpaB
MAKRPGAGGVILMAVILGLVTAYLIWNYLRKMDEKSRKNWAPVVWAVADIKARTMLSREMVELRPTPQELIAPDAVKDIKEIDNSRAIRDIRAKEQVRRSDLAKSNEVVSLAYIVPPGMRAISIAAGEVQSVGTAIKPSDEVDILATYVDPVNRAETTKTILQKVTVVAVNRGQTDAAGKEGATTSMTLLVKPEQVELLTAADRQATLRVSLRPLGDTNLIASAGITVRDIRGGSIETPVATPSQTPVRVITVREEKPETITIIRGTQSKEEPTK